MDKTKILESIFNLAKEGIFVQLDNLPSGISKHVVEKQISYIESRRCRLKQKNLK